MNLLYQSFLNVGLVLVEVGQERCLNRILLCHTGPSVRINGYRGTSECHVDASRMLPHGGMGLYRPIPVKKVSSPRSPLSPTIISPELFSPESMGMKLKPIKTRISLECE
ncbi:hypothetical protein Leryth_000574 [Lithospermum erythrorhizon]|nr:hypothetical protein Leryth_000574 [Lithospermum erythrorhizon]